MASCAWATASLLLLVCLSSPALAESAPAPPAATTPNATAPPRARSLPQVCRADGKKLCDMILVAKCLTDKKEQIQDAVCKDWITARSTCLADAQRSGLCNSQDTPKVCLKKTVGSANAISEPCSTSEFYRSFLMYTRWRRRHPPPTATTTSAANATAPSSPPQRKR